MSIADTIATTFAARDPVAMAASIVGGVVLAIPDATDPQTITTRMSGGVIAPAVAWAGKMWSLDPADSTTDHDEITCIRTIDGDGYFTDDVRLPKSVLSRIEDTPPDPDAVDPEDRPAYGDAYLVPTGATDDWSGHEDEIAVYTARGWVYKTGVSGDIVLVADEGETGEFIHSNASDEWQDGLPSNLTDGSVRPAALLVRSWAVENQTTNTPPATGPAAEQYIIGGAPTGAWAGQTKKIAWRPSTDASFVITTPYVGEEVYDKALGIDYKWNGAIWEPASGVVVGKEFSLATVTSSPSSSGSGLYTYSNASAPTTTTSNFGDSNTIAYEARAAGNYLEFDYQVYIGIATTGYYVVALFRDSETTAIAWEQCYNQDASPIRHLAKFVVTASDGNPHTYTVRFIQMQSGVTLASLGRRLLSVQEVTP